MDMSEEIIRFLVNERLDGARAEARRRALVPPAEPLRVRLGVRLIALGQRLLHQTPTPQRVTP